MDSHTSYSNGNGQETETVEQQGLVQEQTGHTGADANKEQEERVVPWRKLMKYMALAIVGAFLLLLLFDKLIMPWYVKLGAVETVPNVVGMSVEDATAKLEELDFEVKSGEPQYNLDYPAGTVMMQLPYGGAQTKQGRRIYLTLSRGAEMIPMLSLTGMPLREARIALIRKGFEIGDIEYDHNDTIMRDLVYWQSVPARAGAKPGTVVHVKISRGPEVQYTLMPSLTTQSLDAARVALENAGLVLGVVRKKPDPTYVQNTVIEQSAEAYKQVAQGSAIDVTIAVEPGTEVDPAEPIMPNVKPQTEPATKPDDQEKAKPKVSNIPSAKVPK